MRRCRVYLDNCAFNRPFDDKEQLTVEMGAAAKLHIQDEIREGKYDLVWSYMNEYENNDNPYEEKRTAIKVWEKIAEQVCAPTDTILARGKELQKVKIKPKDSLHISCAIESGCEYFITTDVPLLKKQALVPEIKIINPIDFVREMEGPNASDN
jgi:predicted nucleic acid-binding protein